MATSANIAEHQCIVIYYFMPLVVAMRALSSGVFVDVECRESNNGNAETGENALETVKLGERALVAPRLSVVS